ncbi:MAG: metal ABC transporter permease [Spirochaetales bacterium]|nr:metal ABC transporter permease [Spirochaetales bacterium]
MTAFFSDVLVFPFLQYALFAAILSSIACGVVGSYITVKRITYIAGAIAHSILGGMGIAKYLNVTAGLDFIQPLHGAIVFALAAAIIIGLVTLYSKQRIDTVLSAIWAIGMATGILFIYATPGYREDLMSYLFGNILMVGPQDLMLIGILDVIIMTAGILFYTRILAISFDAEYARLRGINVRFYLLALLVLTALTIVVLIQIVGIVMVIALLSLPAATASIFTRQLWQMTLSSILLCLLYTIGGLIISYGPDLPAGATIIVLSGTVYLLVLGAKKLHRASSARRPH